jgi:hypothetical protein
MFLPSTSSRIKNLIFCLMNDNSARSYRFLGHLRPRHAIISASVWQRFGGHQAWPLFWRLPIHVGYYWYGFLDASIPIFVFSIRLAMRQKKNLFAVCILIPSAGGCGFANCAIYYGYAASIIGSKPREIGVLIFRVCRFGARLPYSENGELYEWGSIRNTTAVLGSYAFGFDVVKTPRKVTIPVVDDTSSNFVIAAAVSSVYGNTRNVRGGGFYVVLTESYDIYTWGVNDRGQLGRTSGQEFDPVPRLIDPRGPQYDKMPARKVVATATAALVLYQDGSVGGWGGVATDMTFGNGAPSSLYGLFNRTAASQNHQILNFQTNDVVDVDAATAWNGATHGVACLGAWLRSACVERSLCLSNPFSL